MSAAITYLRVLAAGLCARVWRHLRHGECPCEFCRAHLEFLDDQGDAYTAEVPTLDGRIATLDEARARWSA